MLMPDRFEESVAAVLGSELDTFITADIINLPIYRGAALAELEKIVPNIANIPEDVPARPYADRAIIYATALKVLPYYQQQIMKREQSPAATTERFEIDWTTLQSTLQAELDKALGELNPEHAEKLSAGFVGFRLTFSDRGRGSG